MTREETLEIENEYLREIIREKDELIAKYESKLAKIKEMLEQQQSSNDK